MALDSSTVLAAEDEHIAESQNGQSPGSASSHLPDSDETDPEVGASGLHESIGFREFYPLLHLFPHLHPDEVARISVPSF